MWRMYHSTATLQVPSDCEQSWFEKCNTDVCPCWTLALQKPILKNIQQFPTPVPSSSSFPTQTDQKHTGSVQHINWFLTSRKGLAPPMWAMAEALCWAGPAMPSSVCTSSTTLSSLQTHPLFSLISLPHTQLLTNRPNVPCHIQQLVDQPKQGWLSRATKLSGQNWNTLMQTQCFQYISHTLSDRGYRLVLSSVHNS